MAPIDWPFAAFLGIGGGALIFQAYWDRNRAEASQSWPRTTGKVVSSKLVIRLTELGTKHYAEIIYQYKVMGRTREGSRISFGIRGPMGDKARSLVKEYPEGSSVTVYYNPEKPKDAALNREATDTLLLLLIGLLLLGGAIAFTIYHLTQ